MPSGSWCSSDPKVATVNQNGLVRAVGPGRCNVCFRYGKAGSVRCEVTVAVSSEKTTVLMFHSIMYEAGNKLRIPTEDFDAEMKWLSDNGFDAMTTDELYSHMETKKLFPKKSVVITLDDGYEDNYTNAFPILKKYKLHATIFMITGKIGAPGCLTAAQLREMSDSGLISIQCHTVTHPLLDGLSYAKQYFELSDSKQTLENLLGREVGYLAYPTGHYNRDTINIAQSLGYKMCFAMGGGTGSLGDNDYTFPRAFVDKNLSTLVNAAEGHAKN
jgi:peptidoglycan/xylan/chitin deacetylase (PgdA/CDA1 family)